MNDIRIRLADIVKNTIPIGYEGEENHTKVTFYCSAVFDEYPDAVATMAIKPAVGDAYPQTVTQENGLVVWDVTPANVAGAGSGTFQFTFTDGEEIIKSVIGSYTVSASIIGSGEMPDPVADWVTEANAALAAIPNTISEAIDDALEEAKESGDFKGDPGDPGAKGDPGDPAPASAVAAAVDDYLEENFSNPSNPPLDRSLTSSLSAAPADLVGDLKNEIDEVESAVIESRTITCIDIQGNKKRLNSSGEEKSDSNFRLTDYLPTDARQIAYHVCAVKQTGYVLAAYYDEDKEFISAEEASSTKGGNNVYLEGYLNVPAGAKYFRINMWTNDPIASDREDQYVVYGVNKINEKLSIDQGTANSGKVLFVQKDGEIGLNAEIIPTVNKIGENDMSTEEQTITGAISEINRKNIVQTEKKNLITSDIKNSLTVGKLNTSGIIDTSLTSYSTSDYLPFESYYDWFVVENITIICLFDENKDFIRAWYNGYKIAIEETIKYMRFTVLNTDIDNALICRYEKYKANDLSNEEVTGLNENGKSIAANIVSDLTENDSIRFVDGDNLFNPQKGFLYAATTANTVYNSSSGKINTSGNFIEFNNAIRSGSQTIGTNGCIASSQFIPVTPGKYLFTNYGYWASPCYNAQKECIGNISSGDEYFGKLIPEGCRYIRLNFFANYSSTDPRTLKSFDDVRKIMVYEGDSAFIPTKELNDQRQIDGGFISSNYLDKVVPSMENSEFLSAMKCLAIREVNKRDHAFRFANFNMWVGTGVKGYNKIRRMLMDYGVDFCGFEEASGRKKDIGKFLESWQFASGFESAKNDSGAVVNTQSLVSRYTVQTWNTYTLTSVASNTDCINARIRLPRLNDVYNPYRTLSLYVIHPAIGANMNALANEFLGIIAEDYSDYIVVTSDTNDFSDLRTGKKFWNAMEAGGLTPVIPLESKTITQDDIGKQSDEYPEKQWYWNCIDQIFVSSNIEFVGYGVLNTKDEYPVEGISGGGTNNEPALSDHDFVYADLRFKNEVRDNMPPEQEP